MEIAQGTLHSRRRRANRKALAPRDHVAYRPAMMRPSLSSAHSAPMTSATRRRLLPFTAIVALTIAGTARAARAQTAACSAPPDEATAFVTVPGHPFQALPSADGCWVFVSMAPASPNAQGGIAVLRNMGGHFRLQRVLALPTGGTGMTLTNDGALLVVAAGRVVDFLDVGLLTTGGDAVVGTLEENNVIGRIYATVTPDDRTLFIANENSASITVYDLAKARATKFDGKSVIGEIPTGRAPIALTLSPDGKYLFTTSQAAPPGAKWPVDCRPQGSTDANAAPDHVHGAILVVDVARAQREPSRSVLNTVRAGCNPVRLVLSPQGDVAYVSARTDNALLAFDTRKLVGDTASALLASVPVGTAPVGIAVIEGGAKVLVTNSNRFGGAGADDKQSVTIVDARRMRDGAAAVIGSIPAGAFPREMRLLPGGRVLLLTNFNSNNVEIVDLTRLATGK